LCRPIVNLAARKSATFEIGYCEGEIHFWIKEFTQDLHVLEMVVEAEKESLDPGFKMARLLMLHRPRREVRYETVGLFALEYYVHRFIGCG